MTSLNLIIDYFCFVMALFSVRNWLKAIDYSKYEPIFLKNGYTSYDAVANLTKNDIAGLGVPASRVASLKAVSEDEAIRELSVSVLVYAWLIIVCL